MASCHVSTPFQVILPTCRVSGLLLRTVSSAGVGQSADPYACSWLPLNGGQPSNSTPLLLLMVSVAGCGRLGVGVGLGCDELVMGNGAGAVVGACTVGRPDDEAVGRCVALVATGADWVVAN